MTTPTQTEVTIHSEFILVKDGSNFLIGVEAVQPDSEIKFENVNSLVPLFDGTDPFSIKTESGDDLNCNIPNTCATGAYEFNMCSSGDTPTSFPYTIHVDANGAENAIYRYEDNKLRVVQEVEGNTQTTLNINFKKEGFTEGVKITVTHDANKTSFTIPNGQPSGLWSVQPSAVPTRYTFHVEASNPPQMLFHVPHLEVIGSDESDLDILPPAG